MSQESADLVTTQYMTLFEPPNELDLDCGRRLGPIQVAYETYGRLSEKKDNVVWICHALSGDAHVAGKYDEGDTGTGWWDIMVGPGKPIDTHTYFVVCSNILGGCKGTTGPSSTNPATGRPWGLEFPVVTISDMVRVQKALLDHLGLDQILVVIGGSMGGMQVLEWAIRYPDVVVSALPIATTARLSAQGIAFNAVGRNAILADPDFQNERPTAPHGLAIARMVGHITYLSERSMHEKFGRTLRNGEKYRYDFNSEFSVETYLDHKGQSFVERFDAFSYLYISKAMDYFDPADRFGSLEAAFAQVKSRFMITSFTSDWLFTPQQSQQLLRALLVNGKDVTYCNIESPYGHDAFLLEPEVLGSLLTGFLASNLRKLRQGKTVLPIAENNQKNGSANHHVGRFDYPMIERLVEPNSRILDLGCGDGRLLQLLSQDRNVQSCGVEISQSRILETVGRGLTVIQHDMDAGLPEFPDDSFDYVILSQTLLEVHNPELVLREMLRIGHHAIISFPNFAHWRARWQLAVQGRAPVTGHLPCAWYQTERIRFLSLHDFEEFCDVLGVRMIVRRFLGAEGREIKHLANWRAEQAIYVISRGNGA